MVFRVDAVLVLVPAVGVGLEEMHPSVCQPSVSVVSSQCHFRKEGSGQFDFYKPLARVILSQLSPIHSQEDLQPTSCLSGLLCDGC